MASVPSTIRRSTSLLGWVSQIDQISLSVVLICTGLSLSRNCSNSASRRLSAWSAAVENKQKKQNSVLMKGRVVCRMTQAPGEQRFGPARKRSSIIIRLFFVLAISSAELLLPTSRALPEWTQNLAAWARSQSVLNDAGMSSDKSCPGSNAA